MEACTRAATCVCKEPHTSVTEREMRERRERVKWNVSSGSQFSLKCIKASDTQETQNLSYWGLWSPTCAENVFFILFSYTSTLLLIYSGFEQIHLFWYYSTNQYQNIQLKVLNMCVKSTTEQTDRKIKGSFALGLQELLQLNLDCSFTVFTRSTELTSVKRCIEREGWTLDINFSFRVFS